MPQVSMSSDCVAEKIEVVLHGLRLGESRLHDDRVELIRVLPNASLYQAGQRMWYVSRSCGVLQPLELP
jgi:hypothetical protein